MSYPFSGIQKAVFHVWIFSLGILSFPGTAAGQGCSCTNCPVFMPDNFTGTFPIFISNAANPTLGQNGQGVCGVNISFNHEYIGDLSITLTSPAGQTVTLVGPIGFFGETDGSSWDVSFVPCGDPANPDPGFNAQWNNNQPWGMGNAYSGSYYPAIGCLENFNSGPVNGTWTLSIVDGQANDVGNFLDYEIIFCDPAGIQCYLCIANAGALTQADVTACEGDPALELNLPPTWTPAANQPPSPEYAYLYIISNAAGGVILEYMDQPNLTSYDAGVYNICGLSVLSDQIGLIPPPNGSLTVSQLNAQLNSTAPPFCGKISTINCVNVTINERPDDTEDFETVCSPDCFLFHGQNYCQSGTYTRTLTQNGCQYTATLYLTVLQPSLKTVNETICEESCSQTPGFESECDPGEYMLTLSNAAGCDSIVTLKLNVLTVNVNIVPPPQLACGQNSIQLQGIGSSSGPGVTYLWTASNGGALSGPVTGINATATAAGDYQLRVCRQSGALLCCDSMETQVSVNQTLPPAPGAVAGPAAVCPNQAVTYTVPAVTGATSYSWTLPAGVTVTGGQNTNTINAVWASASGGQVCVAAVNACGPGPTSCLPVVLNSAPTAQTPVGNALICADAVESYSVNPISGATSYNWSVAAPASIVSGQGTTNVSVQWGNAPTGSLCLNVGGVCGNSQDSCLSVAVINPPPAPQITGNATVCTGGNGAYSLSPIIGATEYNWVVAGGVITAGQGLPAIQVSWNPGTTSGQVCATAENACGEGAQGCFSVNLGAPAAGQISHDCDGANQNYTISFPVSGGTGPYTVAGGAVTGGIFTSNPVPSGQNFNFTIVDANGCSSPVVSGVFNCNCATSAGQMDLTLLSTCPGGTVTAVHNGGQNLDGNDVSGYILHDNAGPSAGIIFGQNTSGIFGFQSGMEYDSTYYISFIAGNNLNGFPDLNDPCLSVAQGQPVVFYSNPIADAGIDADTCGLSIDLNANPGNGLWSIHSVPAGGMLNFSNLQNNTATATASLSGVYSLIWTLNNNNCIDGDTIDVSFNASPLATLNSYTCDAANENYTIIFDISGGELPYTVNGPGVLTGSNFASTPVPNLQPYSFTVSDANGCISLPLAGVYSCNCGTAAGQMAQTPLTACVDGSVSAVHLGGQMLDGNDVASYVLHTGSGQVLGAVVDQNSGGVFSFVSGMIPDSTYYISYVVGNDLNGAPDPNDPCLSVSTGQPVKFYPYPQAEAGGTILSCDPAVTLNAATPANGAGVWSVVFAPPGAAVAFTDPQLPNSVATASQPGFYTLEWRVDASGCSAADSVILSIYDPPVPDSISEICDAANQHYNVGFSIVNGTAPFTVNGIQITGNTYVSPAIPSGQTYTFTVIDANGCQAAEIKGSFNCNCITSAGSMVLQPLTACEGATVTAVSNNDQVLDGNDALAFVLHDSPGQSLGKVYAENTTGVFGFQPGMSYGVTYFISAVAGNSLNGLPDSTDGCLSIALGQPVVFLENPVVNAGADGAFCGLNGDLSANTTFPGAWSLVGGAGPVIFNNANSAATVVTAANFGTYTFRFSAANGVCGVTDIVEITFHQIPVIAALQEVCNTDNTGFNVQFTAFGGTSPYSVNGLNGTFTGNVFTSDPLPNGGLYSAVLTDGNGCTKSFDGDHTCPCLTDAGTMNLTPLRLCAGDQASAVWNNNGNTDGNDLIVFVLHDSPTASIGAIQAVNMQPVFDFGPGIQTEKTYYISAVAGNSLNGAVDPNDPCLSVSAGVPVIWKPLPTATIGSDMQICEGETAILQVEGMGEFPLTLTYDDGTGIQTLTLMNNIPIDLNLAPAASADVRLIRVEDTSLPVCATDLSDSVKITVNKALNAGTPAAPFEICFGDAATVDLTGMLQNADPGGVWTETSDTPSLPGGFSPANGNFNTLNQPAGLYSFKYAVDSQAPCPDDDAEVQLTIHPEPAADAGVDQILTCEDVTAELGGPGTSQGPQYVYKWTLGVDSIANSPTLTTQTGGNFRLWVTTDKGCTQTDAVTVMVDNIPPEATKIGVIPITCFGDKNGAISVDSFTTLHPPVLFSLNGGAFGEKQAWFPLGPGTYTVTLLDANGCEWTSQAVKLDEPIQLTAELGANLSINLGEEAYVELVTSAPLSQVKEIIWTPLVDTANAGSYIQRWKPLQSQLLEVTVSDTNGCLAQDRVEILVDRTPRVYFPNVLKPGSSNDGTAYFSGGEDVEMIEKFHIYDRWGELQYEAYQFQPDDPKKGWNGEFKGKQVNPGVYIYYAEIRFIDGRLKIFKGDLTVIR